MEHFNLDGFTVEPITLNNLIKYEDVFYSNNEYYMITDGRSATKQDCIDTVDFCLEGIPRDNFKNIGISCEGRGVACLFLVKGYPTDDTLYIGLFLVHAHFKRKSIGTKCIQTLIQSLKETHIKYIRLSVQDNNSSGYAFWNHMGFSVIQETDCGSYTNLSMQYIL